MAKADEFTARKIVDALKRGNTRRNACALSRVSNRVFSTWMKSDSDFAAQVRNAEAFAEDEGIGRIREGAAGWQGMAWWIARRNRNGRWAERVEAQEKAKLLAKAANSNSLEDVPLDDLEKAIEQAAAAKREIAEKSKKAGNE